MSRYPDNPFPNREPLPLKNCIGTGDITDPNDPIEIVTGIDPEHERLRIRTGSWLEINEKALKASKEKKEWLAEQLAQGRLKTKGQVKAALLHLGCDEAEIERQKFTPTIIALTRDKLQALAVYGTAEALPYQIERAKEDTPAFLAVAKVAEILKPQQGVMVNTFNDNRRNGGDDEGDRQFFQNFQKRSQRLAVVEGTSAVEPDPNP